MLKEIREAIKCHERLYELYGDRLKMKRDNSFGIFNFISHTALNAYSNYLEMKYHKICADAGLIKKVNRDIIVDMIEPIFLGTASTTVNIAFTIDRTYITAITVNSGSKPTIMISDVFLSDKPVNVLSLLIGVMHEAQHVKQHKSEIPLVTFVPDSADYFFHPTEIEARAVSYSEEAIGIYERMIKSIPRQ